MRSSFNANLGKRLMELRKAKGLKQSELAERIDIGRVSVSNYELGDRTPDAEILLKFADFFEVSTDYLLGRNEKVDMERVANIEKLNSITTALIESFRKGV